MRGSRGGRAIDAALSPLAKTPRYPILVFEEFFLGFVCPHKKCPGCPSLHLRYDAQLERKRQKLLDLVADLPQRALQNPKTLVHLTPSPQEQHYRTSSKLVLQEDFSGQLRLGLFQKNSHAIVEIPHCKVHHPLIQKLTDDIFGAKARLLNPIPLEEAPESEHAAGYLTLRCDPHTKSTALLISHYGTPHSKLVTWAKKLKKPSLSVYSSLLDKGGLNRHLGRQAEWVSGPKHLSFSYKNQVIELHPMSFFQANAALQEELVSHVTSLQLPKVKEQPIHSPHRVLFDLYGGFGLYSLALEASPFKRHVVDMNPYGISSLQTHVSKELDSSTRPSMIEGHLESVEKFLKHHPDRSQVENIIINPPRTGVTLDVLQELTRLPNMTSLTYVSCHLGSLKHDLDYLLKNLKARAHKRWSIASVQGFDMFPQTDHLETVVHLTLR